MPRSEGDAQDAARRLAEEKAHKYDLLVKAARWVEEGQYGPIQDFEKELIGDEVLMALLTLFDMQRLVWEPVSELLKVGCFDEVVPAIRALMVEPSEKETGR